MAKLKKEMKEKANEVKLLIYQNSDGNIRIDVRLEEETVWLNQA